MLVGTQTIIPGPSSTITLQSNQGELLAKAAGISKHDRLLLLLRHSDLSPKDPKVEIARESLISLLQVQHQEGSAQVVFSRIESVGRTVKGDENFISDDTTLLVATLYKDIDQSSAELSTIAKTLAEWQQANPGFELHYLSDGSMKQEMFDLIHSDLDNSLLLTIPLTLLVLLFAFRSVVASVLVLLLAILSLIASLGAAALLSQLLGPISASASQLVVLLVLAIGVDYGLFFICRMREEVDKGSTYPQAIRLTLHSTGIAIAWSGLTVAVSLVGLLIMQDSVLSSMALVSITAVLITLVSSLWALPAVLEVLGPRIDYGRFGSHRSNSTIEHGLIPKLLALSLRSPAVTFFTSVLVLLILGSLSTKIILGTTINPQILPSSMQLQSAHLQLEQKFPDLAGVDLTLILEGANIRSLYEDGALEPFSEALQTLPELRGPLMVEISEQGDLIRMLFNVNGDPNSKELQNYVLALRSTLSAQYLQALGIKVYLSGTLPYVVDEIERYRARMPLVLAVVLALSMLFLLLAFRSIIVPLKALVLNLLSCAAAFGSLVLAFQSGLIANWNYGVIEYFVPALLFSILFGLSMDYHVFLLSRIYENSIKGMQLKQAVRLGILSTWRPITSAALIMVTVFAVVASLSLPLMRQLGFGLCIAVLIDATIIRTFLLPSSMLLLGRLNWYLPSWLSWLPRIKLD